MTAPELRRYCLIVQYDGGSFRGWQFQADGRTVQGEMESALARLTGTDRRVIGSGRTDRGVHAIGQVAAVDVPEKWSAGKLRDALNALLPPEVRVMEARRVPPTFHPRYDATGRRYEYRIALGAGADSPFLNRWCWDVSANPPTPELLSDAARLVIGARSFRKFAKAGQPARGDRCRVTDARWSEWGGSGLRFRIEADRFLHHMVRYLVGTMVAVGRGQRPLTELSELLDDPETLLVTSSPAPAHGLFLTRVEYPPDRLGTYPDRDPLSTHGSA